MSLPAIRIILVDDHPYVIESWKELFDHDDRFQVVSQFDDSLEAIQQIAELRPDVVLIDVNMHPINGFETTEKLMKAHPHLKIIGVSVNNQPRYANRLLHIGAQGFVTKNSPFEELCHGIVQVHQGGRYICEEIRRHKDYREE